MTTFKSRDDVLTLLVHLGYLAYDEETQEVFIPNLEIFDEFKNALEGDGWDTLAQILNDSDSLLNATLCGDADAVARGIDKTFADIVFLPRRFHGKPALIVELKWNQSPEGAIRQIKERKYVKALDGYVGEVLLAAVNYDKKSKCHQCIIERFRKEPY